MKIIYSCLKTYTSWLLLLLLRVKNVYKALEVSRIQGSPHDILEKYNKWLTNFVGNKVITNDHLARFYDVVYEDKVPQNHEDVVMKL